MKVFGSGRLINLLYMLLLMFFFPFPFVTMGFIWILLFFFMFVFLRTRWLHRISNLPMLKKMHKKERKGSGPSRLDFHVGKKARQGKWNERGQPVGATLVKLWWERDSHNQLQLSGNKTISVFVCLKGMFAINKYAKKNLTQTKQ